MGLFIKNFSDFNDFSFLLIVNHVCLSQKLVSMIAMNYTMKFELKDKLNPNPNPNRY